MHINDTKQLSGFYAIFIQSVLNMMANEVIRHTQNYRKTLICDVVSIPVNNSPPYVDARPV